MNLARYSACCCLQRLQKVSGFFHRVALICFMAWIKNGLFFMAFFWIFWLWLVGNFSRVVFFFSHSTTYITIIV